jgi:diguanylate cyclase (GGDEF)-like protein
VSDRVAYWLGVIKDKTPEEIAGLIADCEHRATRDKLTGLINKDEFTEQFKGFVDGANRRGSEVYVFFLDFDDLKKTNDQLGHKEGDRLLKDGALILKSVFRSNDLLGRLHGDEFAAAIEVKKNGIKQDEPEYITQRIVSALATGGISISIGISKYESGSDLDDLLSKAGKNMRIDKTDRRAGRDFLK